MSKKKIYGFSFFIIIILCSSLLIFIILQETSKNNFEDLEGTGEDIGGAELRGAWLNPAAFNTPERMYNTLNLLEEGNFNTILLATAMIGDNFGWADLDDFYAMLGNSTARGFDVHVWVSNSDRLWHQTGEVVDFRDSGVYEAQAQWICDLFEAYPSLKGAHYDYIRYRNWEDVNNESKMDAVTTTVHTIAEAVKEQHPNKILSAAIFDEYPNYANFDEEDIPLWFIDWIAANPHPNNHYTTDEKPNGRYVPNGMKYQQNPVEWINSSDINFVISMKYTSDDYYWNKEVEEWNSFLSSRINHVFMGLGHPSSEDEYDPEGLVRKIKHGRENGIHGFVIFELGVPSQYENDTLLIEALTIDGPINNYSAPYKKAISPYYPNRESFQLLF